MSTPKFGALTSLSFALLFVFATAYQATAQAPATRYPKMAPIEQYLMADRGAEIALARSAAPESISRNAEVRALGRHGFETVVKGKNGFVCVVGRGAFGGQGFEKVVREKKGFGCVGGRGWTSAADPDFWNPKVRVPMCMNAP